MKNKYSNSSSKNCKTPRGESHSSSDKKITVGLYLNRKLVEKARDHGLNLSRVTEQALSSILDYLEPQNNQNSSVFLSQGSFPKKVEWAGPDSNQRSSARQADVLTELDYRPFCF